MPLKDQPWRLRLENYPIHGTVPTRYGDLDTNHHLNNVAIAGLVEEARVRFHQHVRRRLATVDPGAIMVVHCGIDYLAEAFHPEDVTTGIAVTAIGRTSYTLGVGLFQANGAFALATSTLVARTGGVIAPLAPEMRALFAELTAP